MTSPSDSAGYTLLEALVALAILALVAGLVAGATRGPSPELALRRTAAERTAEAATTRLSAVRAGATRDFTAPDACGGPGTIRFHPDGTAQGPDLCLTKGDRSLRLALDTMTGRLAAVEERGRRDE
jgi:prepilin-type N-terminal cleavage/methylation domain-containing protein